MNKALVIFAFSNFFLLSGCNEKAPELKEVIRPIAWTQVKASNFDQVRRLSGTIQPVEATNLSFQVGGKIDSVKVNLGEVVKQGDQLATLDQRSFKLSQQSSLASLHQAQSKLRETENEFNRYSELLKQGQVSQSGYENAKAAFESADSAVNLSQAQLNISLKDLNDTLLTAPYNGKITKRLIEPSMQISPGQTAFQIEGEDGLEIQVMVPETLIRDLAKGNQLNISYPAFPDMKASGSITEIGSRAETANAFPVTVLIDSPLIDLRAGMTAEVDFTFKGVGLTGFKGDTYRLPLSAVGADDKQNGYVFVYHPDTQTVNKRIIQTENIFGNEVLVSAGLENDEIIATAGIAFLRDGQSVKLLDKQVQQFN